MNFATDTLALSLSLSQLPSLSLFLGVDFSIDSASFEMLTLLLCVLVFV